MKSKNTYEVVRKEGGVLTNSDAGLIQTQQSSTSVVDEEMEAGEEDLVDYDEDPMVAEKLEMAAIEKRVESRDLKLLENATINIQTDDVEAGKGDGNNKREAKNLEEGAKNYVEKGMEGKENTVNTNSTEDDDEIDWDQVQDALDTNEVVDLTKVKKEED
jgi:hypothetical protein